MQSLFPASFCFLLARLAVFTYTYVVVRLQQEFDGGVVEKEGSRLSGLRFVFEVGIRGELEPRWSEQERVLGPRCGLEFVFCYLP